MSDFNTLEKLKNPETGAIEMSKQDWQDIIKMMIGRGSVIDTTKKSYPHAQDIKILVRE